MKKLDRDEQVIYDAFSQIKVDTEKLKKRVLINQKRPEKKRLKCSVAIVAMMILVGLSATIYAAAGGLEQFRSRFNPDFGEFAIAPVEPAYSEDQGVRIEVVGTQQIDNVVLVYVAMEDVSGENRLTKYTMPDLEIYAGGQIMNGSSSTRRLEFERSTNTLYFERLIVGEVDMPRSDTLELIATTLYNNEHSGQAQKLVEGCWKIQVKTNNLGVQPITWTGITIEDAHIDYMSLSPFGLRIAGSHQWDMNNFNNLNIEVELENRKKKIKLSGMAGGIGTEEFNLYYFADAPIDIDAVTAIIVNGVRIPYEI